MNEAPRRRPWKEKFADALRGWSLVFGEVSFQVHLLCTALLLIVMVFLRVSAIETALLVLAAVLVLSAEILNTSLERMARAVTSVQHPQIRDALDLAGGAVLLTAVGAATVGAVILLPKVYILFSST